MFQELPWNILLLLRWWNCLWSLTARGFSETSPFSNDKTTSRPYVPLTCFCEGASPLEHSRVSVARLVQNPHSIDLFSLVTYRPTHRDPGWVRVTPEWLQWYQPTARGTAGGKERFHRPCLVTETPANIETRSKRNLRISFQSSTPLFFPRLPSNFHWHWNITHVFIILLSPPLGTIHVQPTELLSVFKEIIFTRFLHRSSACIHRHHGNHISSYAYNRAEIMRIYF
jgi:hypothetical protein